MRCILPPQTEQTKFHIETCLFVIFFPYDILHMTSSSPKELIQDPRHECHPEAGTGDVKDLDKVASLPEVLAQHEGPTFVDHGDTKS